ncbi:hypothetical protein MTO96_046011 [Rhipicephalus appendiculatus]
MVSTGTVWIGSRAAASVPPAMRGRLFLSLPTVTCLIGRRKDARFFESIRERGRGGGGLLAPLSFSTHSAATSSSFPCTRFTAPNYIVALSSPRTKDDAGSVARLSRSLIERLRRKAHGHRLRQET